MTKKGFVIIVSIIISLIVVNVLPGETETKLPAMIMPNMTEITVWIGMHDFT